MHSKELHSFQEVYDSVTQGENIKFVIDLGVCVPKKSNILISITPTTILLQDKYLKFSNLSTITSDTSNLWDVVMLEYSTYKLTNKDNLNVSIRGISLPDYTIYTTFDAVCSLKDAVKVFSLLQ